MTFQKQEKKFIKAIVKYGDHAESLADAINKSHILEKRGWNIVLGDDGRSYLFFRQDKYDIEEEQKVRGFLAELLALLDKLYSERLLVAFPSSHNRPLVIGKENVTRYRIDTNTVDNGKEYIVLSQMGFGWYGKNKESLYWWDECTEMVRPFERVLFSAYHVSQDLIELTKNDFKSEEQIRFEKQQRLTWISIAVAGVVGVFSLILSVISLLIR
jgi:hypothetical protein